MDFLWNSFTNIFIGQDAAESSFDGLVSTSNHLLPEKPFVTIQTSRPIWWCVELRQHG